jgi:hypothetical protein
MRMQRVAVVAGCWFLLWMAIGALVGGLSGGSRADVATNVYFGVFNGTLWAVITSFSWPWIMPNSIERWMDR